MSESGRRERREERGAERGSGCGGPGARERAEAAQRARGRTSMMATQLLVVPRSMPMMSLRADAAA